MNETEEEFHTKGCRRDGKCCEVKIRSFNHYARQAYEK